MPMAATSSHWHGVQVRIPSMRMVALALDGTSLAIAVLFVVAVVAFGQHGAEMPTDNWWLFVPMIGAGLAALAGGVVALAAAVKGDRHAILSIPLALGGFAVLAIVGRPLLVLPVIGGGLAWFLVLAKSQKRGRS